MADIVPLVNSDGSFKNQKTVKYIEDKVDSSLGDLNKRISETNIITEMDKNKLNIDLSYAVNYVSVLPPGLGNIDAYFVGEGESTLLFLEDIRTTIDWPGGTVVHGRPALHSQSFAAIMKIADKFHVIWSAVDQTPAPVQGGSGGGVVQASLKDIMYENVTLAPGATVVPNNDSEMWQFTNLHGVDSSDLELTAGFVAITLNNYDYSSFIIESFMPNEYTLIDALLPGNPDGSDLKAGDGWRVLDLPEDSDLFSEFVWPFFNPLQEFFTVDWGKDDDTDFICIKLRGGDYSQKIEKDFVSYDGKYVGFSTKYRGPSLRQSRADSIIPIDRTNEELEAEGFKVNIQFIPAEDFNE